MKGTTRIKLLVIDIVERCVLPQDIVIRRDAVIYSGSITRIPKELLNETVIKIRAKSWQETIVLEIE